VASPPARRIRRCERATDAADRETRIDSHSPSHRGP
jgi:hypothetical protein